MCYYIPLQYSTQIIYKQLNLENNYNFLDNCNAIILPIMMKSGTIGDYVGELFAWVCIERLMNKRCADHDRCCRRFPEAEMFYS